MEGDSVDAQLQLQMQVTEEAYQIQTTPVHEPQPKSFQCDICFMKFTQYANMRRHKLSHSGIRPFECRLCPKKFFRKDHLMEHTVRKHSKQRPLRCPFCVKTFSVIPQLKTHLSADHSSVPKDNVCTICGFIATSTGGAKIHYMTYHIRRALKPAIINSITGAAEPVSLIPVSTSMHNTDQGYCTQTVSSMGKPVRRSPRLNSVSSANDSFTVMDSSTNHQSSSFQNYNAQNYSENGPLISSVSSETTAVENIVVKAEVPDPDETGEEDNTAKNDSGNQTITSDPQSHDEQENSSPQTNTSVQESSYSEEQSRWIEQHNTASSAAGSGEASEIWAAPTNVHARSAVHDLSHMVTTPVCLSSSYPDSSRTPHDVIHVQDLTHAASPSACDKCSLGHSKQHAGIQTPETSVTDSNCDSGIDINHDHHHSNRRGGGSYVCAYCDIVFQDHILYMLHRGSHTFGRPWKCNYCGRICQHKYDFACHLVSHSHC